MTYKAAACHADRVAAFRLVYEAYLGAGLIQPNRYEMRVTPYQLLGTTDIFLAIEGDRPIATVSLIRDGVLGLPCDQLFPGEVRRRRRVGVRLAEASSLAVAATESHKKLVLVGLMRVLAHAARRRRIDELLAAVHPRHASFYENVFSFQRFGAPVPHRQLNHRPAVGLRLGFPKIDAWRVRTYRLFFDSRLPGSLIEPEPISPAEQDFFRVIAAESERWSSIAESGNPGRRLAA